MSSRKLRAGGLIALSALLGLAVLASLPSAGAATGGTYSEMAFSPADEATLDVVIIPPAHGQIYNDNGILGGDPSSELGPFNSYLKALEDAIQEWRRAIDQMAPTWLSQAVTLNSYVVGRDEIPVEVSSDPEILVLNEETKGNTLGLAVGARPVCVILHSSWFVKYFSPEDYYWVSLHELGHCLGLGHVVDDMPPDDLMSPTYKQPIGASSNQLACISTLNIATLEQSFRFLRGLPESMEDVSIPISHYRRDCGDPAGHGPAQPSPSATDPGPNPTPSPEPTVVPSPQPSPSDDREERARWIGSRLVKHLLVKGLIESDGADRRCTAGMRVAIQRRAGGAWRTIATTKTDPRGIFTQRVSDKSGRYRAVARELNAGDARCLRATSRPLWHRH